MNLSNASKYKVDTNLLLIAVNVAELHHQSVLFIGISEEVPVYPQGRVA